MEYDSVGVGGGVLGVGKGELGDGGVGSGVTGGVGVGDGEHGSA